MSLPTLRRYAQVWEKEHGPLPRTPTGDRLWPREVVEAIAEARARGAIGRLTRAKLEADDADEAKGPETAELTLRLEKVEEALKPFQDLSPRVSELEARVRHLEELGLSFRASDLETRSRLLAQRVSEVERAVEGLVHKNLDWRLRKVEEEIQSLLADQRLGKAEKETRVGEVKKELGEVKKELEADLRYLARQIAELKEKLGELEREIEERTQRRPWWRFW